MSKVYVFVAEGFEEIECLTVVDLLRRAEIDTYTVSVTGKITVTGSHKIEIKTDKLYEDVNFENAAMLVLPGGLPGTDHLEAHEGVRETIKDFYKKGKKIAAICAAPSIFANLGLLNGIKATCHPSYEGRLKEKGAVFADESVVISGNIITSRGMGTAVPFSLALITELRNKEISDKIRKAIVY